MNEEPKLKSCPFCGGQAIMKIQKHIPNGYDYTPTCQDPSCAGRLTKKWVNEADAIEAWNKRMCADHFRDLTKMVETFADSDQEWISCSSRLPEEDTEVLVTVHFDGYKDKYTNLKPSDYVGIASQIDGEWASYDDEYKIASHRHHVIAWKPLPEPFKG